MRSNIFIAMLAMMLCWACSSEEPMANAPVNKPDYTGSRYISPEEASAIARQSMVDMELAAESRAGGETYTYIYNPTPVSRGETADTMYYVVNFENGGFALILADRYASVNTIAISATGNFEENSNPASEDYLCDYLNAWIGDGGINIGDIIKPKPYPLQPGDDNPWMFDDDGNRVATFTTTTNYDNFLEVAWEQCYPYNVYCDALSQKDLEEVINQGKQGLYQGRGMVGCVPVAIGQILSKKKTPSEIDGRTLNWDGITSGVNAYMISSTYRDQLAYLLARLGKRMGKTHGITTGAKIGDAKDCLVGLGFSQSRKTSKYDDCYNTLKDGNVAFMGGSSKKGGHAWVVDGYKVIKTEHVQFYEGSSTDYFVKRTDYDHYLSFNWGWGSNDHVYYYAGNPYDTGMKENSNDTETIVYTSNFEFIVDIK